MEISRDRNREYDEVRESKKERLERERMELDKFDLYFQILEQALDPENKIEVKAFNNKLIREVKEKGARIEKLKDPREREAALQQYVNTLLEARKFYKGDDFSTRLYFEDFKRIRKPELGANVEIPEQLTPTEKLEKFIAENPEEWKNLCKNYITIAKEIGHLPTQAELLKRNEKGLLYKIKKCCHLGVFKEKIIPMIENEPIKIPKKFIKDFEGLIKEYPVEWRKLCEEYIDVARNLGYIPSTRDLRKLNKGKFLDKINKYGGFWKFKRKIQPIINNEVFEIPQELVNSFEELIKEYPEEWNKLCNGYNKIVKDLGYLPSRDKLLHLKEGAMVCKIDKLGGFVEFKRRILPIIEEKYIENSRLCKPPGYWNNWKNIEKNMNLIIENEFNGKFPSSLELYEKKHYDILSAVHYHYGGYNVVRKKMGYANEVSERRAYYAIRGYTTEHIATDILRDWADMNGFPYSEKKQIKVGEGHWLEFVCGTNKRYGIDITNSKTVEGVENKWNEKEYHKYVDELWVIVVADNHNEKQFTKWNEESPENVLVINYRKLEKFLNNFSDSDIPFEIPPNKFQKLKALAECTFNNREEIKERFNRGKKSKSPQSSIRDFI